MVDVDSQTVLLDEIAGLTPAAAAVQLRERGLGAESVHELVEAAERFIIADLAKSLSLTEKLVGIADELDEPVARARARRSWAQALAYANRFEEALATLNEATELADRAGAIVEAARCRLTTLHALARLGRHDEAVAVGESARAAFVEAGERVLAARADINLGVTRRMQDQPRAALAHFDRARLSLDDQPMLLAPLESNRAEALLDLNRFTEAERAFLAARVAFEQAGAGRASAIVEGNLADLASRRGRLDKAIEHFERAMRRLGETEAPGDVARLRAEQAEALAALGMHAEAAETYRRAVPVLRDRKMAWEAARALAGLGRTLVALGRAEEAEPELAAAASAFEALKHSTGLGRVRINQASVAATRRRYQEAEGLLTMAADLLADRPAEMVLTRLHLSTLALAAGRLDEAEQRATAALLDARELDLAPLVADLLHVLARIRRAQGRTPEAVATLREAIREVERVRGMLGADRFRAAFLGGRMSVFEDAIAAVLDMDGPGAADEAFTLAERAKSRSLLDLLRGGAHVVESLGSSATDTDEAELLSEVSRLRGELNALYAQLDDPSRRKGADLPEWRRSVRDYEVRISGLERRLAATHRYSAVFGDPVGLDAATAMLGQNTGLVEFFVESGRYSAIVATRENREVFRGLASPEEIADRVEALYFQVGRAIARGLPDGPTGDRLADAAETEAAALCRLLVEPMADAIEPLTRLIVVPHGGLHAVPFHTLCRSDGAIIETKEVLYTPSASVLDQMLRQPDAAPGASTKRHSVVIGFSDELIPHAEREAREVAECLGDARLLIGADATIERVVKETRGAGLVHFATHARFIHANPMASGIKLADGWLSGRDIYGMRLDGAAVTLSGCDTGRSALTAGEELMGLTRAFLVAGARSLLLSLWPTHDRYTAELMLQVYTQRYDSSGSVKGGVAGALRRAQLDLRRRQRHIAAWGPYLLIGAA